MILKELNLVSFGKFKNKIIGLDDGLNVVYGENESGKTTIHNFIEGMFYGFLKPYASRRNFLEELEKYRPWSDEKYYGILTLQKGEKTYRIERDFNKGKVRVYDELTGKDITDDIDLGEKLKIHLPGLYFFDFNSFVYRNTISIKQLENKVDSDLSKEIKDKLINITTSLDNEISVKNAIAHMDKRLDSIGTERAYTKPYGRAIKELQELKDRRKEILERKAEYEDTKERLLQLKEEIKVKETEIGVLKSKLEKAKIFEMKKTYEEVLSIKDEIHILDEKIESLREYSNLSIDDYYVALKIDSQLNMLENTIDELLERLKNIDTKIEEIAEKEINSIEHNSINNNELYEDFSQYNHMEDEKNSLLINGIENRIEILNSQLKGLKESKKRSLIQFITFLIVSLVSIGLYPVNKYFLALTGISFILTIYSLYMNSKLKKEIVPLDASIGELKQKEEERREAIERITKHQKDILEKYNCSSKIEFNRFYDNIRFLQTSRNAILEELERLNIEKRKVERLINEKTNNKEQLISSLRNLLSKNKVNSLIEFKEALDKKRVYDNLIKSKENKLVLLESILRKANLEDLEEKVAQLNEDYEDTDLINIDETEEEIRTMGKSLEELKYEYSKIEERIDMLNGYVEELANIEEDIVKTEREIDSFKEEILSIKIAKEVMENISERIHKQFAPDINENVSQLISFITNGKYGKIKVDDHLDISVENPLTGELIPLNCLSGGTIDQIHFALRFSIMDSMKKDNFPLILDDSFIQYDDKRIENILKFLGKLSERNQIILFTCHSREREMLNRMSLKYNFINIS